MDVTFRQQSLFHSFVVVRAFPDGGLLLSRCNLITRQMVERKCRWHWCFRRDAGSGLTQIPGVQLRVPACLSISLRGVGYAIRLRSGAGKRASGNSQNSGINEAHALSTFPRGRHDPLRTLRSLTAKDSQHAVPGSAERRRSVGAPSAVATEQQADPREWMSANVGHSGASTGMCCPNLHRYPKFSSGIPLVCRSHCAVTWSGRLGMPGTGSIGSVHV